MIVRCPNTSCNTKMAVKEEVLRSPSAMVKCPSCKERFKPFDRLPLSQKKQISNKSKELESPISSKKSDERTDIKDADKNRGKEPLGWLIVHDEKTHTQTYDLFEGVQLIGRKSDSRPCDVMIETTDTFMSRNHFTLEVISSYGRNQYVLKDAKATNRTYVETKMLADFVKELRPLKAGEEVYVEDGDIIQAGNTKIILKTPKTASNRESATQIVTNQKITKTVIV